MLFLSVGRNYPKMSDIVVDTLRIDGGIILMINPPLAYQGKISLLSYFPPFTENPSAKRAKLYQMRSMTYMMV